MKAYGEVGVQLPSVLALEHQWSISSPS